MVFFHIFDTKLISAFLYVDGIAYSTAGRA